MKQTIIILTLLITGCGSGTTDTVTSVNEKDSIIKDTAETVVAATLEREDEDFSAFFEKFTTDSLFQVERVKFPWTLMTWEIDEDAPIKESIHIEDWRFAPFYYEDSYSTRQTDAYTQEIKHYCDTVKIEIRGVDNGIFINYEFIKDNNEWFLVSAKDYSN